MGFYFKVAPGVRIRATSRGIRTSVGPRAARVHFGAGGTGFSTGAGPVSLYRSAGGGRRRRSGPGPSRTSLAAHERQLRQAQKAQQAQELKAAFDAIENLHRQDFTLAAPPVAPAPAPVDEAAIRRWHEQQALRGLNVMQRSARAAARKQAAEAARRDITSAVTQGRQAQAQLQRQLDEQWDRLLANDPDIVFATLTEAFEDNQAHAAVAGVDRGEAAVLVMVPGIEAVPERMPKLTPAGNLSIAKLTKGVRNSYYLGLVCGYVLVTVREALAVAPGLQAVRVAVVRRAAADAYGARKVDCLLAAVFPRQRLDGVRWQSADAIRIVQDTCNDLRIRLSATHEMLPLDLSNEPSLAALVQAIDTDEAGLPPGGDEPLAGHTSSQLPDGTAASGHRVAAPTEPIPHEPALAAPPPSRQQRSRKGTRRASKKPVKTAAVALTAFALLLIIIALATGGGNAKQTGNASTVAASTPTRAATPSRTPTHHAAKKKTRPNETPVTAQATAPAAAPSPAAATTPAGCHPLSNEGTCYEPGEYCRDADHGASGVAGDGEAITCEYNDGWRWEPS